MNFVIWLFFTHHNALQVIHVALCINIAWLDNISWHGRIFYYPFVIHSSAVSIFWLLWGTLLERFTHVALWEVCLLPPAAHRASGHTSPSFTIHLLPQQGTVCACVCVCTWVKSLQSCLTLYITMYYSLPGSSVLGILQARVVEWVAMPSSRGTSWPRDLTLVSCFNRWVLDYKHHLGSPQWTLDPFKSLPGKMIIQWTGLFLFFIFRAAVCYYWSNQHIFCYFSDDSNSVGLCYFFFFSFNCFIFLSLFIFPVFILASTFCFGGFLKSYICMWGLRADLVERVGVSEEFHWGQTFPEVSPKRQSL